jgi:hypothetical protein
VCVLSLPFDIEAIGLVSGVIMEYPITCCARGSVEYTDRVKAN